MKRPTISQQMLELLKDGKPHSVAELHKFCGPSLRGVVRFHIRTIRDKFLKPNEAVLCVLHESVIHYQLVLIYCPT
jgi:hypothetical protein